MKKLLLTFMFGLLALPALAADANQLVHTEVTLPRFHGLYNNVMEQYVAFQPEGARRMLATELAADMVFQDQVIDIVRQNLAKTFSADDLAKLASFAASEAGQSLVQKMNDYGLGLRHQFLNDEEKAALKNFSQDPAVQAMQPKALIFMASSLQQINQAFDDELKARLQR